LEIANLSPNIDKQEMRNYLLGNLEAERRAALEESILCDPGIYEELLVVEAELIDQYITNNLSPSERQQFETHFLITAERQKNLRFGRLLRRYLNSQPVIVPPEDIPVSSVRQDEIHAPATKFFAFGAGTFARTATLAVSAAVVVGLLILVVLCWRANRRPEPYTAQESSSDSVKVVQLSPGSLRSEGAVTPRVKVPPKGVNVRLDMEVPNPHFHNYKSELFRENESLQKADELKAEPKGTQHVVPWTIMGDVLSPGDYKVQLKGVVESGQDEYIDNYSFRVVKK
jgi:hypothetical protein